MSATPGEVSIQWISPVYASGALEKYEVEWADARYKRHSPSLSCAGSIDVEADKMFAVLHDLIPGKTYDISVTAVVKREEAAKKLDLDEDDEEVIEEVMRFTSEVLRYRVPAPIEALEVLLTGYGCGHIDLRWAKPELFSPHKMTGKLCDMQHYTNTL